MDGYTLAAQLRRTRRRYRLSATSQALYYELVAIANEEGWPDNFKCSNGELCSTLVITEKTLILARQELIQGDLVAYKSGKSKKTFSDYSFLTTVKFTASPTANATADKTAVAPDYNKLKEKPKPNKAAVVTFTDALDFFKSTKNRRLLMEKFHLNEIELEWYFLVFYDSKVDLGDLDGKTLEDTAKNFYFWLPKHLAAQQSEKAVNVKRNTSNVQPTRGVAAALQFTDVQMRE